MKKTTTRETVSVAVCDDISYNHTVTDKATPELFTYHSHDRYEIIFLIKGNMKYIAEGRGYDLEVGDLILTRAGVFHSIFPSETTHYDRYDAIINERLIPKSIRDKIPKMKDVFRCAGCERIFELFAKLDFYYGKFSEDEYNRLTFNVIEEIIFNLTLLDEDGERGSVNPLIDKATAYIREHLTEIKGIEEISSALYITKSHLHHIFIKELRMTPAKYILSKRLILAEKKLRRGAKPTEIYAECGFEDYTTFFRNYKKYFGSSPSVATDISIRRELI